MCNLTGFLARLPAQNKKTEMVWTLAVKMLIITCINSSALRLFASVTMEAS